MKYQFLLLSLFLHTSNTLPSKKSPHKQLERAILSNDVPTIKELLQHDPTLHVSKETIVKAIIQNCANSLKLLQEQGVLIKYLQTYPEYYYKNLNKNSYEATPKTTVYILMSAINIYSHETLDILLTIPYFAKLLKDSDVLKNALERSARTDSFNVKQLLLCNVTIPAKLELNDAAAELFKLSLDDVEAIKQLTLFNALLAKQSQKRLPVDMLKEIISYLPRKPLSHCVTYEKIKTDIFNKKQSQWELSRKRV